MKLKTKFLASLFLGWIIIIVLPLLIGWLVTAKIFNFPNPYIFLSLYSLCSLLFLGFTWLFANQRIIKRIVSLQQKITPASTDSSMDELTLLEKSLERYSPRAEKRYEILQNTIDKLKQQLLEHKLIERELIINKEHLVKLAHFDGLTQLPNRVFFNEQLNSAIKQAKRHNHVIGILLINLDDFNKINAQYDHRIGDLVLKEVALRISSVLRTGDIVARLGGDEFVILLNDMTQPIFASAVAEKILRNCARPIKIIEEPISISASIGITVFPADGDSLETLQKNADVAVFKAKQDGGNSYQYYQREMHSAAQKHLQMETELQAAITNNELVLHYQPQLSLEDGSIKSIEALIRWQHPTRGLISPEKFIPFAEQTSLIIPIGDWALREACRMNKHWQEQGYDPLIMAVNISPKQFHNQDVVQHIKDALHETGLEARYLELEITETALMDNADGVVEKLNRIHDMGVKISIDDFGTGYTSINYLKQFPIDVLKIDQIFIKGIPHKQNDVAITSTVISLGHTLGLEIVAEGVETTEQMRFLAEQKCDVIQGYFLSRPLPAHKICLQLPKKGRTKEKFFNK